MSVPLSSLKILDFSTLLPGPFASMILADLGAEVLRLESPQRQDLVKKIGQKVKTNSATHATINRSKQFLSLTVIISVLLSGIAISMSARRFAKKRMNT